MSNENEEIMEIVETEEIEVEEKKSHKGAIAAAIAAGVVGIGCGIKWVIGKLRDTDINYVDAEEDDESYSSDEYEVVEEDSEE